jgi:hypothetical protein
MPILWDRHFSKKLLTVTESGFFLFRMQDEDINWGKTIAPAKSNLPAPVQGVGFFVSACLGT